MILFSPSNLQGKDGSLSVAILGHLYQNNNNMWNHPPSEA